MAIEYIETRTLSHAAIQTLRDEMLGDVVTMSDNRYAGLRNVFNTNIDLYPTLIARCHDTADVVLAVKFARRHGLRVAVRSGGHSLAGHGTVDGGIVLDLSLMKHLSIDPKHREAWVESGVTWGEYAEEAQKYGLATPAGDAASVGVGGLTLGGGIGWLVRKHGLTIDHLVSAEVVTADGRILNTSENENSDLFWALRGGGGNFGIVTGFGFRLQPVGQVLGGAVIYPATREVIAGYVEAAEAAPEELTTISSVVDAAVLPMLPPELAGQQVFAVLLCWSGDTDAGQPAIEPMRHLGGMQPLVEMVMPMPYNGMFAFTAEASQSRRHAIRAGFSYELGDEAIETVLRNAARAPSPGCVTQIRVLGGAMARVDADETAFGHRDKHFMTTIIAAWDDEGANDRHEDWVLDSWEAIEPLTDGAYVNFLADEGPARIRDAYSPDSYARLSEIKRRYDPENLFRLNQNIKPA